MLTNLYDETLNILSRNGYVLSDIEHIILCGTGIAPTEFIRFAGEFEYDNGYGVEYVPPFVLKMNDGSWYTRAEYDGSEWWQHHKAPAAPVVFGSIAETLKRFDMDYWFKQATACSTASCETLLMEEYEAQLAEYEEWQEAMRKERMDALYDELEDALWRPDEPISGKWDWRKGGCATKSHCKRWKYSDRPFTKGGGEWACHNSRCWKDQRGKGAHKRNTQYRA